MKVSIIISLIVTLMSHFTLGFVNRKIFVSKFAGNTYKNINELEHLQKNFSDDFKRQLYLLPGNVKQELVKLADHALNGTWEVKTATDYMMYFRNGNRNIYESKLHRHTNRISHLLIGQLLEQEKNDSSVKYMNQIINGIWIMMEDSTWVYPAHLYIQNSSEPLPLPDREAIDLNAGENAKFVAWVKILLHDQFDHVSSAINERIDFELKRRIFEPYLKHENFFWMGFHSHNVNNWNIWINGNILKAAMLTLKDDKLFNAVVNKTLYSADYFLDEYGKDGGCNEGPVYWRQAGGRLIEYIESLSILYKAKSYFKQIDLIKKIGEYVYKMHIDQNWYVNFADAIPVINYPPSLLAKYGILFDDKNMMHFSAYVYQFYKDYYKTVVDDINEFRNFLDTRVQIESVKPLSPNFDYNWLSDIQVFTSRSTPQKPNLFIGAKFGTNHESHNHNDVGSFVLFQNGNPILIDIGVGTYNATTFGNHRFDIFYFKSEYHNCPTINGVNQMQGDYLAKHVHFHVSDNKEVITFTGDIAEAYPTKANVASWNRTIHFNRSSNIVQLNENFKLKKFLTPQEINFITINKMKHVKKDWGLLLHYDEIMINMEFDWNMFQLKIEDKELDNDSHLTNVWGKSIRRIILVTADHYKETHGNFTVRFSIPEIKVDLSHH